MPFWLKNCTKRYYFYIKVVVITAACAFSPQLLAQTPPSLFTSDTKSFDTENSQHPDSAIQASLKYHLITGRLPQLGTYLANAPTLYDFYDAKGFIRLWQPLYREHSPLQELLAYLQQIHLHGLLASDYHLQLLIDRCQMPARNLIAECDVLQTDALLSLTRHFQSGKINPNLIFGQTEVTKPLVDPVHWLNKALDTPSLVDYFKEIEPDSLEYHTLKEYLTSLSSREAPDWPVLALMPAIKPQMDDPRLSSIVERLMFWGDLSADWTHETPFPLIYEDDLIRAVEAFQLRHGLKVDGLLGKNTLATLNITPQQRIEQLSVNLERIRWYEQKPVKRLIKVNIASFELLALKDGQVSLRAAVIVGQINRPTPIFEDKIQYLVLNPTWVVPWKLATRDKLPLIQENPQYLLDNQFSVYLQDFKIENPADIDWKQVSKSQFPYRLVQAPGLNNALGQVKFMFPNTHQVYLHDTPTKSLFNNELRAFSSGCIRLQDPIELLWWLLRSDGLSDIDIKIQLHKKHTNTVYLGTAVPIRLEYRTAYLDQNQTIQFRADIYKRDSKLYQALRQPAASFLLR